MAERRKTLGLRLKGKKRQRVDSDPSDDIQSRNRPRLEDNPSRQRSLSIGESSTRPREPASTTEDSGIGPSLGFTVPGFNYLGPGNPLDNGPPTNRVDEAARRHDFRYAEAQKLYENTGNREEAYDNIQAADEVFLDELNELTPESYTESFGKLLGQTGIGIKKSVENVLHSTLYPTFSNTMDVDSVDGNTESKIQTNFHENPSASIISLREGVNRSNNANWNFIKHFELALESHALSYSKSDSTEQQTKGKTEIKAYIHSLPWEKIYFYLTEREYNTIVNTFHTAYVESVTVKIFNMGVTTTSIQSSATSFKTLSTNHYLGIWRGFEKYGAVKLGTKITPSVLYGSPLEKIKKSSSEKAVPKDNFGAISEMKTVDNRITYSKITSSWENNGSLNKEEASMFLPPLVEMATVMANASTSVGLLYQATYKPKDGMFHNRSSAFHNDSVVQHKPYEVNIDLADEGKISNAKYVITDTVKNNKPAIAYTDATIDNMFFRSIRGFEPLHFIDGLGIGLFPKRTKDDSLLEGTLDLYIQTEIRIRGEAFGGSVQFSGNSSGAQVNPNKIYFVHEKKKFGNAYASDGLPTLANAS